MEILGTIQLQHIPLDLGSPIVNASSADPYISILTADGQVITLMLREGRGSARLVVSKSTLSNVSNSKEPFDVLLLSKTFRRQL